MKILNPFRKNKSTSVKFWINQVISDFWSATLPGDTTPSGLIKTAETIPDVFMITDYVATVVSNLPVKIVNKKGKDIQNRDLERLIKSPNYYQNWREMMKQFVAYYELLGNSYLYAPPPTGLNTLSSIYVLPANFTGVLLAYDRRRPSWLNEVKGYVVEVDGNTYNLTYDEVLHKRYYTYQYEQGAWAYGISKYIPGERITTELKAIYDAKTSIIKNRGALGVMSNESEIPDPNMTKEIQDRFSENYGLGADQSKIIATTQKLSWQQISMNLQELQIIENARYSFEKLCQLNGIDPVIFSTVGSTFANKSEAQKAFMKNVIKPKADDIYNDLNSWIAPYFDNAMIVVDWSQVEELQRDMKTLSEIYIKLIQAQVVTPYQAAVELGIQIDEANPPSNEFKKDPEPPKPEEVKPDEEQDEPDKPTESDDVNKTKYKSNGHQTPVILIDN